MSNVTLFGSDMVTNYAVAVFITVAFAILIYIIMCSDCENENCKDTKNEHYVVYSERDKWNCKECGFLTRAQCGNCVNCGYCYDYRGRGQCVPGDENGPYFREDCADYEYISPVYYVGGIYYPRWQLFYNNDYDGIRRHRRRAPSHSHHIPHPKPPRKPDVIGGPRPGNGRPRPSGSGGSRSGGGRIPNGRSGGRIGGAGHGGRSGGSSGGRFGRR